MISSKTIQKNLVTVLVAISLTPHSLRARDNSLESTLVAAACGIGGFMLGKWAWNSYCDRSDAQQLLEVDRKLEAAERDVARLETYSNHQMHVDQRAALRVLHDIDLHDRDTVEQSVRRLPNISHQTIPSLAQDRSFLERVVKAWRSVKSNDRADAADIAREDLARLYDLDGRIEKIASSVREHNSFVDLYTAIMYTLEDHAVGLAWYDHGLIVIDVNSSQSRYPYLAYKKVIDAHISRLSSALASAYKRGLVKQLHEYGQDILASLEKYRSVLVASERYAQEQFAQRREQQQQEALDLQRRQIEAMERQARAMQQRNDLERQKLLYEVIKPATPVQVTVHNEVQVVTKPEVSAKKHKKEVVYADTDSVFAASLLYSNFG